MLVYNTLSRKKESLVPQEEGKINLYVCGITAYDYSHIGHARSAVVFDVLVRRLRRLGYVVNFVRNFTDIDDKIIAKANQEHLSTQEISEKFMTAFHEDMDRLGILRPDKEPRATDYVEQMISLAADLIEKGHAYATPSGDVYFRVRSVPGYGQLSGRNIEEMRSGARVLPGEEKEDPLDFALWKSAKPGEPKWTSPWGEGRPGWHLECSAMSEDLLPLPLDIHGGGRDLIFPHHENEIAQTKAARNIDLSKYWMHNGFVNINSEKMSKSLGNFIILRDIYEKYHPEVLRFFLLGAHYRSPLDFSLDALDEAEKGLKRIYTVLSALQQALENKKWSGSKIPEELQREIEEQINDYEQAMDDDLNTAAALGHIFSLVRLVGRILEDKTLRKSAAGRDILVRVNDFFKLCAQDLGLFTLEPLAFMEELRSLRIQRKGIDREAVEALLQKRLEARKAKDFDQADAIRGELANLGVEVMDTPAGQVWDVLQ